MALQQQALQRQLMMQQLMMRNAAQQSVGAAGPRVSAAQAKQEREARRVSNEPCLACLVFLYAPAWGLDTFTSAPACRAWALVWVLGKCWLFGAGA